MKRYVKAASGREYKATTIDPITHMEILLSDVSYNHAMSWLASKGFTDYDDYNQIDVNTCELVFSKPTHRTFRYDEARGLLLGD